MTASGGSRPPAVEQTLHDAFFQKREALVLFLAARTRCMATAEDLVQDLYLKLAQLPPGEEVRSPASLLYRMAANLLIDHVRSTQRSARRNADWRAVSREALGGEDIVDEPAADEVVASRQRLRQLVEAVAELPPKMGRAFRLHKLEGLSQAETARLMGVSVKMVEQHIQGAVRQLTARLRP